MVLFRTYRYSLQRTKKLSCDETSLVERLEARF